MTSCLSSFVLIDHEVERNMIFVYRKSLRRVSRHLLSSVCYLYVGIIMFWNVNWFSVSVFYSNTHSKCMCSVYNTNDHVIKNIFMWDSITSTMKILKRCLPLYCIKENYRKIVHMWVETTVAVSTRIYVGRSRWYCTLLLHHVLQAEIRAAAKCHISRLCWNCSLVLTQSYDRTHWGAEAKF